MAVLTRLYDNHEDAVATVHGLEAAGISHDDISLVGSNRGGLYSGSTTTPAASAPTSTAGHEEKAIEGAGGGATAGTIIGGGAGLMAGIGALAIPGLGPVVAAGWLVAAITGAGVGAAIGTGAGGLIGSLTAEGVSESDAHVYAEGVRRGGYLVTARVEHMRVAETQRILSGRGVDTAKRRLAYEQEGWTKFNPDAQPYSSTSTTRSPV